MYRLNTVQIMLATVVAALVATGCSREAQAPVPSSQPDTRSELEVSAGLVPQMDEAVLRNTVDFCIEHAPPARKAVESAWSLWQDRNAPRLAVARIYRQRLEDTAANGTGESERQANQTLLDQHATLIESFTNQQLDVMRVALEHDQPEVVTQLCTEHFARVSAGDWDIGQRDPEIAALLDAGPPKPSMPASAPTPPNPGQR
ncbi:hypothetical protein [Cupriavidus pauculus]|uniref:DUF4142 domain-containing protein n=1 Tax=Cupriavidus pauculus TaxID=82633 RepID=A0A2N5CC94_9BURK|nr:hypothetical protein [Cupriavidus pauculus]PLP99825.1 hypothetical protein CYJ10_15705 [Cupriavidus pauculus]